MVAEQAHNLLVASSNLAPAAEMPLNTPGSLPGVFISATTGNRIREGSVKINPYFYYPCKNVILFLTFVVP